MRSTVSEGGGNASLAKRVSVWRTGCPERSGIRRVWGEVSGCNRGATHRWTGRPKMGQGRARIMGAKALLIHPSYQGVCWRHDTEDSCV